MSRQESTQAGPEKAAIIVKEISTTEEKACNPGGQQERSPKANCNPRRLQTDLAAESGSHPDGPGFRGTEDTRLRSPWSLVLQFWRIVMASLKVR